MKTVSYQPIDIDGSTAVMPKPENITPFETQGEENLQVTEDILPEEQSVKDADGGACDGGDGEDIKDAPENGNISVFEQVGWNEKVRDFLQAYPIAKDFAAQIGRIIANSEQLSQDENCLEKALATALAGAYVSPEKLATDEEFLQKYVFGNQSLKDRIIQEYLDGLQQNLPPKSISARGQITLTPPSKPTSIAEAGNVFKAMFNNRRI
ncbi:MAG: hypothetical protein K2K85_00185 [Clostridia bacterium]|nr:hypothetical protein [Clostridia bacterium]